MYRNIRQTLCNNTWDEVKLWKKQIYNSDTQILFYLRKKKKQFLPSFSLNSHKSASINTQETKDIIEKVYATKIHI